MGFSIINVVEECTCLQKWVSLVRQSFHLQICDLGLLCVDGLVPLIQDVFFVSLMVY